MKAPAELLDEEQEHGAVRHVRRAREAGVDGEAAHGQQGLGWRQEEQAVESEH